MRLNAQSARRAAEAARASRAGSWVGLLRATAYAALDHDALMVAQATAYAAMVALFPALIVSAAVVALLPDNQPLRFQMSMFFDRVLPSNVSPLLQTYFETTHKSPQTAHALIGSVVVSVTGAAGVVATLMEAFRRAHNLPSEAGMFWRRRGRSLLLVPLSLIPMAVASAMVVFGHALSEWVMGHLRRWGGLAVHVVSVGLRWAVALAGSVGIIAVIYHLGTDVRKHMREHMEPVSRVPHGLELAEQPAGRGGGDGDVVCDDAGVWVLRDAVCELFAGVWVAGSGDRAAVLAVHYCAERAVAGRSSMRSWRLQADGNRFARWTAVPQRGRASCCGSGQVE